MIYGGKSKSSTPLEHGRTEESQHESTPEISGRII